MSFDKLEGREGTEKKSETSSTLTVEVMFSENSRRDSKKRRRCSDRRRVLNRLGVSAAAATVRPDSERRRSSQYLDQQPEDSASSANIAADQTNITMKIQFYITLAPENEPLIVDHSSQLISEQQQQQQQQQKRQLSSESNSIVSEFIGDRLNRLNSSTRKRHQLLAMHQQSALEEAKSLPLAAENDRVHSPPEPAASNTRQSFRSGSFSVSSRQAPAGQANQDELSGRLATGRAEGGLRSSTITDGIQDEHTMRFLSRHQQLTQTSGSLTSNSANSLLGQHQTLMASSNNIRQRLEQREHIYFKRDGQRFGHEFTLKLAVDRNYRCLIKVRPIIPLQSISIHGHHVSFVDCSQSGAAGANLSASLSASLGDSPLSVHSMSCGQEQQVQYTRHQSIASPLVGGAGQNRRSLANQVKLAAAAARTGQTTAGGAKWGQQHSGEHKNCSSASLTSLGHHQNHAHQKQLLKQQQHNQMLRNFASSSHGSSSHLGSQLVYMFDWSASRFEVTKNKARTTVQTVLKFKNGEMLSLPLQIKFYQPECKQHLSWGSQLHFIDYECQINSMGQISVERVQYY